MSHALSSPYRGTRRRTARTAFLTAILLSSGTCYLAVPAHAGPIAATGVASSAYGASAQITVNGKVKGFAPIDPVAGSGDNGYDVTARLAAALRNVPLTNSVVHPALRVTEAGIKTHASSSGFGVDAISAEADTHIRSASIVVMLVPPPPVALATIGSPILPQPFLQVSATNIVASASWSEVVPNHISVLGAASFGSLTISGSLIGNQTLTFAGNAAKNTVLYDKGGVTITLDKQIIAGLISCGLDCTFTPSSIVTEALDISLHSAIIGGRKMSGDIILGQALADPPTVPEPSGIGVLLAGIAGLGYLRRQRRTEAFQVASPSGSPPKA